MPYTVPIGPYHPALDEPYKVSVTCGGEQVQNISVAVGYSFRGIELLAQRRNWVEAVTLIERVCGICSNVHAVTFCMAAEAIAGIEVPPRAQYIRTIMYELERMHSHLLWAAAAAECVGFQTLYMETFALRERVMDLIEAVSGNRVQYGMNRIGGVNRDIADPDRVASEVSAIGASIERTLVPPFLRDRSVLNRTVGVGRLTREQAVEWGVVGPVARASGLAIDLRRDHPHAAYPDLDFKVCCSKAGDCFARYLVRMDEILESLKIVSQAIENLPGGPVNVDVNSRAVLPDQQAVYRRIEGLIQHFELIMPNRQWDPPVDEVYGAVEAPNGELGFYVVSDGSGVAYRARCRPPSFIHFAIFPYLMVGHQLSDLVAVLGSLNIIAAELDR